MSLFSSLRVLFGMSSRSEAGGLDTPVDPRHEEEVAGPRLHRVGAREKHVGKGVADHADPEFVLRVALAKQLDDLGHASAVQLGVVDPAEE